MTTLLEHTQIGYDAASLVYSASKNKGDIVRKKWKETTGDQSHIWRDLLTRCRWCSKFQEKTLLPIIGEAIISLSGLNPPPPKKMRLKSPVSFSAEPCNLCKSLVLSFSPNDQEHRLSTMPWENQYFSIFEDLVADAYKVMGVGVTTLNAINAMRDSLGAESAHALKLWDTTVRASEDFLALGRSCFAQTEREQSRRIRTWFNQSRYNMAKAEIWSKYAGTPPSTYKSVSGLYAINEELLCPTCAANVEPNPIKWSY